MVAAVVGSRISCEGYAGTIRYIGEVPPNVDLWWGIEWDNSSRGKHDGSHNGVRYFQTKHSTSGSFVRPSKCSLGISVIEAVKKKYVCMEEDGLGNQRNGEVDERIIGTLENKEILFVGMSNILKEQRSLETLRHINLRGCDISHAGILLNQGEADSKEGVHSKLPSVNELDISENLFSDCDEILNIIMNLPSLQIINLQGNVFCKGIPTLQKTLDDIQKQKPPFRTSPQIIRQQIGDQQEQLSNEKNIFNLRNIKEVCLNNLAFDWENILCFCVFTVSNLKTLVASNNQVKFIDLTLHTKISEQLLWQPLSMINSLDLEGNPIESWEEVLKLDLVMPLLKTLVLNSCNLSEVYFTSKNLESENGKVNIFSQLLSISLSRNNISSWESVNELNRLQALKHLNMTSNPIDEGLGTFQYWGHKVVARIGRLMHLNRVKIDRFDRRGAEIDYLKACAAESSGGEINEIFLRKHPRYKELVDKYGEPDVAAPEVKVADVKAGLLNINILLISSCATSDDSANQKEEILATAKQRLPKTMTVGRLKTMLKRIFKKDLDKYIRHSKNDFLSLSYSSASTLDQNIVTPGSSLEIPIDDLFKDISYYSLCDGDTIYVRMT